ILQYLLGLGRLGHEVWLVEPVQPAALEGGGAAFERSGSAAYFRRVVADVGLASRAALLLAGTRRTVGVAHEQLGTAARRADLRAELDHDRAADRAGRVAGRGAGRARRADDGRELARLRLDRARGGALRAEGALASAPDRPAGADRRAVRAGAGDPPGRDEGP